MGAMAPLWAYGGAYDRVFFVVTGEQKHSWKFGMGWLKPWEPGEKWLYYCRLGVMQYVFMETIFAPLILLTRMLGLYGETTPTDFKKMYPWSTMLVSFSQMYALYCLIHFYYGTKTILQPVRPLTKFVSVKLIVFATFWQAFAL
jgi:hypothetical protein